MEKPKEFDRKKFSTIIFEDLEFSSENSNHPNINYNLAIDIFNLKTLSELISTYLKCYSTSSKLINTDSISTLLVDIFKSKNEQLTISKSKIQDYRYTPHVNLFEEIRKNNPIYLEALEEFTNTISLDLEKTKYYNDFINEIIMKEKKSQTSIYYFLHFDTEENESIDKIVNYYKTNSRSKLLFEIFKHAILHYQSNNQYKLAERIYNEALTMNPKSAVRYELLKFASRLGHDYAAILYAEHIYDDREERLKYFFIAKKTDISLWELAFILENVDLTENQFKSIQRNINTIVKLRNYNINFLENYEFNVSENITDHFTRKCLLLAFKIYLYLANERKFSKAFNSVGKLLIATKQISVFDKNTSSINIIKTQEIAQSYLRKGILYSNIYSYGTMSSYFIDNNINIEKVKEMLKYPAALQDVESLIQLAILYFTQDKDYATSLKYLKLAEQLSNDTITNNAYFKVSAKNQFYIAFYQLKIYMNYNDYENAKKYYNIAIECQKNTDENLINISEFIDILNNLQNKCNDIENDSK